MAPLVPRSLEWTATAPVRIAATATSDAPREDVFAVLADHERWPEWFPAVRRVSVLGPASGVGARRRVFIPGATVDEEFIAWEPGVRWTFTGVEASPRFTRALVEDCVLEPLGGGGTAITYTMYLDPPPVLRPVMRLAAGRIRANNARALEALAARATDRRP